MDEYLAIVANHCNGRTTTLLIQANSDREALLTAIRDKTYNLGINKKLSVPELIQELCNYLLNVKIVKIEKPLNKHFCITLMYYGQSELKSCAFILRKTKDETELDLVLKALLMSNFYIMQFAYRMLHQLPNFSLEQALKFLTEKHISVTIADVGDLWHKD